MILMAWPAAALEDYSELRTMTFREPKLAAALLNERLDHRLHTAEDYGLLSALLGGAYTGLRRWDDALRVVDRALLRLPDAPSEPRGELLMVRAFIMADRGDVHGALVIYDEVVTLAEQLELTRLKAEAHTGAATLYATLDQFEPALTQIRAAHELSQGLDDLRTRALVANEMATLYAYMGQAETALTYYQQSFELSWQQGELVEAMVSLYNLAGTLRDLQRYDEAQQRFSEVLRLARDLGSVEDQASALQAIADVELQRQQPQEAWRWLEELAKLEYGSSDAEFAIGNFLLRAEVLLALGRNADAELAMTEARRLLTSNSEIAALYTTGYPDKVEAAVRAAQGNHLLAYQLMQRYTDNLRAHFDKRSREHETRLRVAFDVERQQSEYRLLAKQNQLQRTALEQASERQRIWTAAGIGATAAASLASIVALVAWRARRRWLKGLSMDPLTGVAHRATFFVQAEKAFAGPQTERPWALILFDIDRLRQVNSHFGYDAGDRLLSRVISQIRGQLPADALMGRIGGGEFAVLLVDCDLAGAGAIAQRLRGELEQADFSALAAGLQVTASFGVTCRNPGETLEALLGRAEVLLLAARAAGRNRVEMDDKQD
ncbi:MAG: diguanylate cyclase [Gammaproteobacteria bacterium]|nr:diguanylate cyclase [Gammaproteobacteria bacterium]